MISMAMRLFVALHASLLVGGPNDGSDGNDGGNEQLLVIRSVCITTTLLLYGIMIILCAVFLDSTHRIIDTMMRSLVMVLTVLATIQVILPSSEAVIEVMIHIVLTLMVIVSVYAFLPCTRISRRRALTDYVTRTETIRFTKDTESGQSEILHEYKVSLDLQHQRNDKIWQPFWDTVMESDPVLLHQQYQRMSIGQRSDESRLWPITNKKVVERHLENKKIAKDFGAQCYGMNVDRLSDELLGNVSFMKTLRIITIKLQGPDVYWNGPCSVLSIEDPVVIREVMSKDCSRSHFGTLSVIPFPFGLQLTFDEGRTVTFEVFEPGVMKRLTLLVAQNTNKEILQRKRVRLQLRAMNGTECNWPLKRWITKRITRKVAYRTTDDGEALYKTQSKQIQVAFTFRMATLQIVEQGFRVTLEYYDGMASYHDHEWNMKYEFGDEHYSLNASEFGAHEYTPNGALNRFFHLNFDRNTETFEQIMAEKLTQWNSDRQRMCTEAVDKENSLSYAFWYFVYCDDTLTFDAVHSAMIYEHNNLLHGLTDRFESEFKMLYRDYLAFYNAKYENAYWFLFWNDIWRNNQEIQPMQDQNTQRHFNCELMFQCQLLRELGDDRYRSKKYCVALNVMSRWKLVELLREKGLYLKKRGRRNGWINEDIIDQLYEAMRYFKGKGQEQHQPHCLQQMRRSLDLQQFESKYSCAASLITTLFERNI